MVISRTGSASAPSLTIIPSAPTEKSPLMGLTPEWIPETDWTSSPSPTSARIWSGPSGPGTMPTARAPTPGPLLKPARTAEAVDAVPARRPA